MSAGPLINSTPPPKIGTIMPEPGMEERMSDCGDKSPISHHDMSQAKSAAMRAQSGKPTPLQLYDQKYLADTWAKETDKSLRKILKPLGV